MRATAPIGISNLILFADLAGTVSGAAAPFTVNDLYETANLAGRWDIVLAGFDLYGELGLAGFANFSDLSFLARLSTSVRVPGLVPFTFALSWAGGGDGKEFTYFAGNNSLSAELRVSYEFQRPQVGHRRRY